MDQKVKALEEELDAPRPVYAVLAWLIVAVVSEALLRAFIDNTDLPDSVARILIVFISLHIIHRFALLSLRRYQPELKDLVTVTVLLIGSVIMVFVGRLVGSSLSAHVTQLALPGITTMGLSIDPETLLYAIPYATGGVLVNCVLGMQYGLVFALNFGLILSLYSPGASLLLPFVVATTLSGCLGTLKFRSRASYVRSGLNVTIISIPFALSWILMSNSTSAVNMTAVLIASLIGGMFCSFFVGGLIPVLEHLGGYVTDLSLLEIATLDHPLLKELSVTAPGTWNHSMVMGMMAEQAAEAIGANPVVSRVGAYFHDTGKMKTPLYFVENQERGENRHDKLSPSMSALIIRSHVKDGIKMAKEHNLPRIIEDMIPQHHGTSLIEFFYEKACQEAEEAGETTEVDKSLYSYPGPKPQTKEAGILMLADGIEAATRTLSDPTFDRIQGLVQKMINKVFASGQLDECELTLKDLHAIAKCFTRILTSIHHQRIAYPEPAEKGREREDEDEESKDEDQSEDTVKSSALKTDEKMDGNGDGSEEEQTSERERGKEGSKEDLKRLGVE